MRYPEADWNPAPQGCYTARETPKLGVCLHRMAGWAGYLRKHQYLNDGRKISAHFTVAMDGSVEQHVETEEIAWTQGIRRARYAQVKWPLFRQRNPNTDLIGIELEDGAKGFSRSRPPSDEQLLALKKLVRWLFEEKVVLGEPKVGTTIIGHMHVNPAMRPDDPGKWFVKKIMPELASFAGGPPKRRRRRAPSATIAFRLRTLERRVDRMERTG